MSIEIITTADGSSSLLNVSLNETYHSVHGAIRESLHVFVQSGLMPLVRGDRAEISILEIGLGTGLNALLTLQHAGSHRKSVNYVAIEPYPLSENILSGLNYPQALRLADEYQAIHLSEWHAGIPLTPYFTLSKEQATLQEAILGIHKFDLVYFDAFAPSKQPELWELPMLKKVVDAMKPGGVFVTYCAKGQLKRDLKSLALNVETLPGPPGKKQMVRASKA